MTDSDALAHVHRTAERLARQSYGRLLAILAARTHDVTGAEDALADAFAAALRVWPERGVPDNPDAWLLTAARHRQTDAARRRQTHASHEEQLRRMVDALEHTAQTADEIPDRRLALMFACAHPAIDAATRAPLMLQTILGLTAEAIAQAFLVPAATMGQRLSRAKARIRQAGIPFRVPDREELPERLDAVLEAIYAAYSRGWVETGEGAPSPFTGEAIWLGQIVVSLLPAEPEAKGLLALMLYADARRAARRDRQGAYVPLDDQDVAAWDMPQLQEAEALLRAASAGGPSGRYQLEAAIQSAHVARRLSSVDVRRALVSLYDHLVALTGSPVAQLNRAVAIADLDGPLAALDALSPLADLPRMLAYQPYWAARGHLLALAGRRAEAAAAVTTAMTLSTDDAVTRYLSDRRAALGETGSATERP
jgi:RNA polymerase sigma-70 factor (ECF subfamily)